MALHHLLRTAREQTGLTLEEAAQRVGISGASFSRMETGQSRITTDRLEELARLYQVSASALLEGSLVTRPSTVDIDRMRSVVETIQEVVLSLGAQPSPEKLGLVVAEIYRLEIDTMIADPKATFDPTRHRTLIKAMFIG